MVYFCGNPQVDVHREYFCHVALRLQAAPAAQACVDRVSQQLPVAGEEQKACWGNMLHGLDSLGSEGAEWALCYLPPNTLLPNA